MVELAVPLNTLIELEPRPDGTMVERRYKINIDSQSEDDVRFPWICKRSLSMWLQFASLRPCHRDLCSIAMPSQSTPVQRHWPCTKVQNKNKSGVPAESHALCSSSR